MSFSPLFISHGSPMLALEATPARDFLSRLGNRLGRPKAILAVSAHWETRGAFRVNTTAHPETIHDFGGFPQALYQMQYPAPGDPALAGRVQSALTEQGLPIVADPQHGLDHGAWVPLMLMYPDANIPVVQLSIQPDQPPEEHYRMGHALRDVLSEDVLLMTSGSATHNLGALGMQDTQPPDWVLKFDNWLKAKLETGDTEALLDFYQQAPDALRNHPTPEHFLPLLVALGAVGAPYTTTRLHDSFEYGALSMAAYAFQPAA